MAPVVAAIAKYGEATDNGRQSFVWTTVEGLATGFACKNMLPLDE